MPYQEESERRRKLKELQRMQRWFRKSTLTDDQIDIWMEKLQGIHPDILSEIVDQVLDMSKYMPTPGEIKTMHGHFKAANPKKFINPDVRRENCDMCDGAGMIFAWKETQGIPYRYACPCGHCDNWKRIFPNSKPGTLKIWTGSEIIARGFSLDDPYRSGRDRYGDEGTECGAERF